jgi:hypothetical protein
MGTNIDKFVEPIELPASAGIPIGGIIMWMNPSAASMNPTLPTGFEYCDGTAVVTGGSTLLGQAKPNLMITSAGGVKGFARGADVNSAPYGIGTAIILGGGETHDHGNVNDNGSHNHSSPSHQHGVNADNANHGHGFTGLNNLPSPGVSYPPAGPQNWAENTHTHGTSNANATHSHGGVTAFFSVSTDNNGNHGHSTNAAGHLPTFSELAYIIRVI